MVRSRSRLGFAITFGSVMHAAGHAFLAGAAGVLARTLAGARQPNVMMDVGSTTDLTVANTALTGTTDALVLVAICGVFAAIAKLVGGALSSWAEARVAAEVGANVRLHVLDGVLNVDRVNGTARHDDHGASGSAERIAALTTHVHDIERGVAHGVLLEARAIVQLAPLAVLLVVLAPSLAASAVISLVAFAFLAFSLRRAFKRAHKSAVASSSALINAADEAVRHAELWATYGAKRRIRAHVQSIGRIIARETANIRVRASILSSTSEVLGALALVLVLILARAGALGVDHGMVVPFAIAFFMAYKPLRDLVDARIARAHGDEALRAAFAAVPETVEQKPTPAVTPRTWSLEPLLIRNARPHHGELSSLSLEVAKGSIVVIVGPTGIGKTSLFRALLGLDALREGDVVYGTHTLKGVGPHERPFAWVPQDAPIVGDTLAINVALGRADDDAVVPDPRPFLAELGAASLADALKDDVLATVRPISGGERQWIAMARALATGLPVLLLDEPTSALDAGSQDRLLEAIARLRGKRTVILITHRPEPLRIADVIVRLTSGGAQNIEDRARGDLDPVGAKEIAVQDVRAGAARES